MALSNSVRRERDAPPLLPPPVPVTRELGERVEVISHADHSRFRSYKKCPTCREGVKNFFSSLGLLGDDVTSTLSLSDCVVITTDVYDTDTERVARWLGDLGLRAVAEDTTDRFTPVLLPGQTPKSRDQPREAAWRARVVSGTDTEGRPVLHVVRHVDFLGLERAVVVVWHQDSEDEDRQRQRQTDRDGRMYSHRWLWFRAATRCQGRLLLVAATPSPALSLLPASSPARGRSNRLRPRCEATEKHRSAGTDPTQSATLIDSLLACVRPPASRRAVSTDPTPPSSGTPSDSTTAPERAHRRCTLQ